MVSLGGVCVEHLPSLSQGEARTCVCKFCVLVGGKAACTPGAVEVQVLSRNLQCDGVQQFSGGCLRCCQLLQARGQNMPEGNSKHRGPEIGTSLRSRKKTDLAGMWQVEMGDPQAVMETGQMARTLTATVEGCGFLSALGNPWRVSSRGVTAPGV